MSYDEWHYYVPQDGMQTRQTCSVRVVRETICTRILTSPIFVCRDRVRMSCSSVLFASKCTQGQILNIQSALVGKLPFCNTSQAGDISRCCMVVAIRIRVSYVVIHSYHSLLSLKHKTHTHTGTPAPDGRLECRSITDT